jgi:hypothetical protein
MLVSIQIGESLSDSSDRVIIFSIESKAQILKTPT